MLGAALLSILLVALLVTVHLLCTYWVRERQRVELRLVSLERQAVSHDAIQTAIHHFRHDLNNLLFSMSAAHEVARMTLKTNQPERVSQALDQVRTQLRHSMDFVQRFRPGSGHEPDAPVDMQQLALLMARPLAVPTSQLYLDPALAGWVVRAPPVTLAILVGNLIKNALEASGSVRIFRQGSALAVENPIQRVDLPVLLGDDIYAPGFSTKGDERGVGLDSAARAAEGCGLGLTHEVFHKRSAPWVRFLVDFGDAADRWSEELDDQAGAPLLPRTATLGDWPPEAR